VGPASPAQLADDAVARRLAATPFPGGHARYRCSKNSVLCARVKAQITDAFTQRPMPATWW
jgi:hypothetical protein